MKIKTVLFFCHDLIYLSSLEFGYTLLRTSHRWIKSITVKYHHFLNNNEDNMMFSAAISNSSIGII